MEFDIMKLNTEYQEKLRNQEVSSGHDTDEDNTNDREARLRVIEIER